MDTAATNADSTVAVAETTTKKRGPYRKATERQVAAALLLDAGMAAKDVAKQLGYSEKNARNLPIRIKGSAAGEYLSKKRIGKSKKVVDAFLEGRPVGKIVENGEVVAPGVMPKDSTILAAAMSVIDRAYPKQSESGPASVSFTTINLTLAQSPKPTLLDDALDVTPIAAT